LLELWRGGRDYASRSEGLGMDERPETSVGPVIGHMQTDTFCEGCGYNLVTQAVMRDERLWVLVCRCPECGRYGAAGKSTTARQVWLNRFGVALLAAWALFLIFALGMLTLFQGIMANGHARGGVEYDQTTFQPAATMPVRWVPPSFRLRDPPATAEEERERWTEDMMVRAGATFFGMLTGGFAAVFMWHLKRWWRVVAFVPPLVGVGFAALGWSNMASMRYVREFGYGRMREILLLECIGVAVGLWLGRPVARAVLTILLPPKPRQHLAFLWRTDGKELKL